MTYIPIVERGATVRDCIDGLVHYHRANSNGVPVTLCGLSVSRWGVVYGSENENNVVTCISCVGKRSYELPALQKR